MSAITWVTANVLVRWNAQHVGGRHRPTVAEKYEGVAKFSGRPDNFWSILLVFEEELGADCVGRATVTLRAHWAPADLLRKNTKFFIVEGDKIVAEVEVIDAPGQTSISPLFAGRT